MSWTQTVLLGALAGFTIFLGLPAGRITKLNDKVRAFLAMSSVGILLFLFFDILAQVEEPVEAALEAGNFAQFGLLLGIFVLGFGLGLLGLTAFGQRFTQKEAVPGKTPSPARLALVIASGIGLHNFSEGLAIGQAAGSGAMSFAILLIIGFGLHNATEGFGIVGPLAGRERPSWKFLGLAGLIGGGPTFIGTLIGYIFVSQALSVLFLALAAGAIVYIIGELFRLERPVSARMAAGWGVLAGLLLALLTDMLLVLAGV